LESDGISKLYIFSTVTWQYFGKMVKGRNRRLNLIKEALKAQGKTQAWLAEKLDKDYVTVTRYANNVTQPSLETLFEIARLLRISTKDLIND